MVWQGGTLRATASIGIAASLPPHASFDELLSQVDTACHEAKELGGNRLLVAGQNVESLRSRSRMMRHALDAREALDHRRFELWCQPIVNLRAPGAVQTHFEVLLRWRDGEGRLRAPADMIAAAERYRLGPRLDRHVLDTVLDWLDAHRAAAAQIGQCNINLGAATLADDEFCVKAWSENEPLIAPLLAAGLFEDTGRRTPTGYAVSPTWRIKDRQFVPPLRGR